jgi:hypothetical protein
MSVEGDECDETESFDGSYNFLIEASGGVFL